MPNQFELDRRAVLKGIAGVALPLPLLEAMGKEVAEETPKRFCALYIANPTVSVLIFPPTIMVNTLRV